VKRLIAVPSGAMLGVPLEALIDTNGQYLIENFDISYAPSATLAVRLSEGSRHPDSQRILLLGDPPFDPDSDFDPIPNTRDEVLEIASLFSGAKVYLGADASEQNMVELANKGELSSYAVIHFATHGLVDHRRVDRSALLLAQLNLPGAANAVLHDKRVYDGKVTAGEIVREWQLDADLVTLSACETALGRRAGGEGYVGLSSAFIQAGARRVVVSLWNVDDVVTRWLMREFYQRIAAGTSEAVALSEAKRVVATSASNPHPAYWAAFVLMGAAH
jgi:CHAT domain-containing protein